MLPLAMLPAGLFALRSIPAGTELHIRLQTPVASYSTKAGAPVRAVLIAPVGNNGEVLLAAGSALSGRVERAERVGFGIAHETAALDLAFDRIEIAGRGASIATRVEDVDNSRERVAPDGTIHGVRTTASIAYRASGYIRTAMCWSIHARLAFWAVKMLIVQVPEPEIYFPSGAELTLWLTEPLIAAAGPDATPGFTDSQRAAIETAVQTTPYRTSTRSSHPSDLLNVFLVGSRKDIAAAFQSAGWTETRPPSLASRLKGVRAVIEARGDRAAPMSALFVNGAAPQMSWQKGLNDLAKRHHIRLWRQQGTWNGKEIWAAAATRDVSFAYLRPGQAVTHEIEHDIDLERDKIAHDLEFTGCAAAADLWNRPGVPLSAHNATGDFMTTDGRIAVLRIGDCQVSRVARAAAPRVHGNYFQRLARREILSVRSDFYRKNIYWRTYEGARWTVLAIRHRSPHPRQFQPGLAGESFFDKARDSSWLR